MLASPALLHTGMPTLRQKCACEGVQHAGGGARRGAQNVHADVHCWQHARIACLTQAAASLQRYVYMRLDYHETAPAEYEPPGFGPMDNAHVVQYNRKPFRLCDAVHARCPLQIALCRLTAFVAAGRWAPCTPRTTAWRSE